MSKIIIHNNASGLSDHEAVNMVNKVIADGKMSGTGGTNTEQYCYATSFKPTDLTLKYKYMVVCNRRKNTDTYTFKVYREH